MTAPSRDRMGRRRSVTVGFRVSPEEAREIDALVALSGLTKQDYILRRLTDREVAVYPSVRVQRAVQDQAMLCYEELRRIERPTCSTRSRRPSLGSDGRRGRPPSTSSARP